MNNSQTSTIIGAIKNNNFKLIYSILEKINIINKSVFKLIAVFSIKNSKVEMLNKLFEQHITIEIPYVIIRYCILYALESKNAVILKIVLDTFDMNINKYWSISRSSIYMIAPDVIMLAIKIGKTDLLDMILNTFLKQNIQIDSRYVYILIDSVNKMIEKENNFIILDKIITIFSKSNLNINFKYVINLAMLNKILLYILKNESNQSIYLFNKMLGFVDNNIDKIINPEFYINLYKFFINSRTVAIDYIFKNSSNNYITEINYKYNHILKIINFYYYLLFNIDNDFNSHKIVNKIVNSKIKYNSSLLVPDAIYKVIYSFL